MLSENGEHKSVKRFICELWKYDSGEQSYFSISLDTKSNCNPRIQHALPRYDPWHLPGWTGIHTPHIATDYQHSTDSHQHWLKEEKESQLTFIVHSRTLNSCGSFACDYSMQSCSLDALSRLYRCIRMSRGVLPQCGFWHLFDQIGIRTADIATDPLRGLSAIYQHQLQKLYLSIFIHSISMSSGHVIIQSHPIFDMLWADFTFITRGSSVFGLDVVFNNCSARLVSTGQAFPLAPTKTCHQFLRIHCKMKKTRQLRQNVFSMSQYNWDFLWALARWFLRAILFLSISGHFGQ